MTITDTFDYTEIDREYDREIARLERERRARGEDTDFPVFAVTLDSLDDVIAEGRTEWGHPGTWDGSREIDPETDPEFVELPQAEVVEPEGPTVCSQGLHEVTAKTVEKDGECRPCRNIRRRRNAAAKRGAPLCWTATHPEPDEGFICECGEAPPPDDFIDWVLVENAVAGRELCRPLTTAEQSSCLITVRRRADKRMGPFEARTWLHENTEVRLSDRQVKYLVWEWKGEQLSALGAFLRDMQEAAGQEESRPAA